MILQELVKYYDRKLKEGEIAPPGFEYKEIPYLIVIKSDGSFVRFESTWQDEKEKTAKKFLVPKGVKKARGIASNLLWDNPEYIFGLEKETGDKKKISFIENIYKLQKIQKIKKLDAVQLFLQTIKLNDLKKDYLWDKIHKTGRNLTFKINTDQDIVCADEKVYISIEKYYNESPSDKLSICLITGKKAPISRLHDSIQGFTRTGVNIVSFNIDSFESYGKKQSYNAPVGERSMFAYTTALNTMLAKDSRQKIRLADSTAVFWAEKPTPLESVFSDFFNPAFNEEKKLEEKELEGIRLLYKSPLSGKNSIFEDKSGFYVLGFSPNRARLSVRFWYQGTVSEVASNIKQHFDDLKIERGNSKFDTLPLYWLLRATTKLGKTENIHPILAGEIMQSILSGRAYPRLLLLQTMNRLQADHDPESIKNNEYARMAILKAYLNRYYRFTKNQNFKEIKKTMDKENINTAYRLGNAFAVMENIQIKAIPGANSTIRDRYFKSASTRPAYVFPVLLSNAQHHISKLEGQGVVRDKQLQEILLEVHNFPRILSLEDQGMFALGYYHQKHDLYKKKEDNVKK